MTPFRGDHPRTVEEGDTQVSLTLNFYVTPSRVTPTVSWLEGKPVPTEGRPLSPKSLS